MRVMIVSCSYLLYEYLLKPKKKLSSALSSASWFCPRPRPRCFVLVLVLRSLASINITEYCLLCSHGEQCAVQIQEWRCTKNA